MRGRGQRPRQGTHRKHGREIAKATGAKVIAVVADVATPAGQDALFAAMPEPDIL